MDKRLGQIEALARALQAIRDDNRAGKAPKKAQRLVQRLLERNPEADQEAIVESVMAQARNDPQLLAEFLWMFFDDAYPPVKKTAAGKPLTKEEQRRWKKLGNAEH